MRLKCFFFIPGFVFFDIGHLITRVSFVFDSSKLCRRVVAVEARSDFQRTNHLIRRALIDAAVHSLAEPWQSWYKRLVWAATAMTRPFP